MTEKMSTCLITVLLFALQCLKAESETLYEDCGSSSSVLSVQVADCNANPCTMIIGSDVPVNISFVASEPTVGLEPSVFIFLTQGGSLDLTGDLGFTSNACANIVVGNCPLEVDEILKYSITAKIPRDLPPMSGILAISLLGDGSDPQVCVEVDSEIRA